MGTVNDSYLQCAASFSLLVEVLKISSHGFTGEIPLEGVVNEHARFNVWAGSVGAKHPPHKRISLDYRLRDSNFYTIRVVEILQRLESTLKIASQLTSGEQPRLERVEPKFDQYRDNGSDRSSTTSSTDSSSSDDTDMLTLKRQIAVLYESVQNSVRHLYSLAMVIRKPVATDRVARASKISIDHFYSIDQRHIEECFPDASPTMKKRLGSAISRRRQLLMYNEQHYRKSSEPQSSKRPETADYTAPQEPQDNISEQIPQSPPDTPERVKVPAADTVYHAPSVVQGSILASTEATKFAPPADMKEEPDTQSESGTISTFGFTDAGGEKLWIPPRPQDSDGESLEQFLCPLCFHLIEVRGMRAWTRHVFRDLQAYVCTFDNCETSDTLFETRQDWIQHEMENHRREWHCNDSQHALCGTESDFVAHIKTFHKLQLSESQLLSIVKLCERPSTADTHVCPLCTDGYCKVENGFEKFKSSSYIRQINSSILPGALDNESLNMAKLPLGEFNEIANETGLGKITPWVNSLPDEYEFPDASSPRTPEEPHPSQPATPKRAACSVSSNMLKRHLGQHLERLALFSINRSKFIPEDGKSVCTEDAVARSDSSLDSFESCGSPNSDRDSEEDHVALGDSVENLPKDLPMSLEATAEDYIAITTEDRVLRRLKAKKARGAKLTESESTKLIVLSLKAERRAQTAQARREAEQAAKEAEYASSQEDDETIAMRNGETDMPEDKTETLFAAASDRISPENPDVNSNNKAGYSSARKPPNLVQLVRETLVEGSFNGRSFLFSPEGSLNSIMTEQSILQAFCEEDQVPSDLTDSVLTETVTSILGGSKKLLAILVMCGFESMRLYRLISLFIQKGLSDNRLPLEESVLRIISRSDLSDVQDSRDSDATGKAEHSLSGFSIDNFCRIQQWRFCAPVFSAEQCAYNLLQNTTLPFLKEANMEAWTVEGVSRYRIHKCHLETSGWGMPKPEYVAIKRVKSLRDDFLNIIKAPYQKHIVKLFAAFSLGDTETHLMFEWAEGGNLRNLWEEFQPENPNGDLVKAVIEQLSGLAHALADLHSRDLRHGSLKPERILWFKSKDSARDLIGILKIKGLSITNEHSDVRRIRSERRVTIYESERYESPENGLLGTQALVARSRSRSVDIWAMGCIALEFLVWILYGPSGVDTLNKSMETNSSAFEPQAKFWQVDNGGNKAVNGVVVNLMDQIAKDLGRMTGQTALSDLLELIRDRLLVVDLLAGFGSARDVSDTVNDSDSHGSGLNTATSISPATLQGTMEAPVITLAEPFAAQEQDLPGKGKQPVKKARARAKEFSERMDRILHSGPREEYWLFSPSLPFPSFRPHGLHPNSAQHISSKEGEDPGVSAEMDRQRIEAIQSSAGDNYLSVMDEESWSASRTADSNQPKINQGGSTYTITSPESEIANAAEGINFDFSILKLEAPQEFQALGQVLSSKQRQEAEDGALHITARKLAALFGPLLDQTPNLFKAYGMRCSQIVSNGDVNPLGSEKDDPIISQEKGVDCTSIWAVATSGDPAVAMHLLACMIARAWGTREALSIWAEIVSQRQHEIREKESTDISELLAATQEVSREQLAQWDASARSWLLFADQANEIKVKQTQLQLILQNVAALPINSATSVYEKVIHAWKGAMTLVEKLIAGRPQVVYNGAVFLGLSSWHLFPDLIVLGDTVTEVKQNDPLIAPGGILTLGPAKTY
ncbi:serine/threonine protein kinase [Fusarium oxysporum f. sp. lycopersici MN25]|nr:serine/threonine protein kinase [Fusarium oxysporum f. sp. lycopersici MN25]